VTSQHGPSALEDGETRQRDSGQPLIPEIIEGGHEHHEIPDPPIFTQTRVRMVSCWPSCLIISLVLSLVLTLLLNVIL
jgi:hypothetical protein